jgi:formamidopyrimidine-DNA glycosylase
MLNHQLSSFRMVIKGVQITEVRRRAKILALHLSHDRCLLIHLKMTGQLVYGGKKQRVIGGHPIKEGFEHDPNKFTHATFTFTDGTHLYFNDVRKFGWLRLYHCREVPGEFERLGLGPEPLEKDFTLNELRRALAKKPKAKIKQFLMDSSNVVGIGNIYSDEICFFARIRPERKVKTLAEKEIALVFKGIKKILAEAIKYEGTSVSDYVNALGEAGAYTKKLKIYGRYGEKCKVCGGEVKRLKMGGRNSSYCPRCQK